MMDRMVGKCQDCGERKQIWRAARCYPCYQRHLDKLADEKKMSREAANLWRNLGFGEEEKEAAT